MDKIIYQIREENTKEEKSYGIEIIKNGVQIKYLPNVFNEKAHAEKLVETCNKYEISPIHILDIIDDMYYDIRQSI